jgi:hypothetical protein
MALFYMPTSFSAAQTAGVLGRLSRARAGAGGGGGDGGGGAMAWPDP